MELMVEAQVIPITLRGDGVARIGKTRVTLQTVIAAFRRGETPETIVDHYPALTLAEVYLVIGYYLEHRAEVDAYMQEQEAWAARVQQEVEARFDPTGIRARLIARMEQKNQRK